MLLCTKADSSSWVAHHSSQKTGSVLLPTIIWKENPEIVHAMRSRSLNLSGLSYLYLHLVEETVRNHPFSSYTSANSVTETELHPRSVMLPNQQLSKYDRAIGSKRNHYLGFSHCFHRGTF